MNDKPIFIPYDSQNYSGYNCEIIDPSYFEWLALQPWIETSPVWADVAEWMRGKGYLERADSNTV